jgi:hypothetical protein
MKGFGIALAVLILFLVGTTVATQPIPKPQQGETYSGESSVEGAGKFSIKKKFKISAIAIEFREWIRGYTGPKGGFAMEAKEILNGDVDITDPNDPDFFQTKTIDFSGEWIRGSSVYGSPSFYGGIGARVTEDYNVQELRKQETTTIKTTSAVNQKQALTYNTMNEFEGEWGTTVEWKKPWEKDVKHTEKYEGTFAVARNLIFEETVVP